MEAMSAKRRRLIDQLYESWDVNASGYLEVEEIQVVLNKWQADNVDNFKEGENHALSDSCALFIITFRWALNVGRNFPLKYGVVDDVVVIMITVRFGAAERVKWTVCGEGDWTRSCKQL